MKLILKIAGVIVIAILLILSVYVIFFTGDNEPPSIDSITGDTTGKKGESITISVTFSDDINVTNAKIFYKTTSADYWSSMSILSGSINIYIPYSIPVRAHKSLISDMLFCSLYPSSGHRMDPGIQ